MKYKIMPEKEITLIDVRKQLHYIMEDVRAGDQTQAYCKLMFLFSGLTEQEKQKTMEVKNEKTV